MSRNIEENIVKMGFDNQNFETNVRTSMSTLDRLKSALKFDGITRGFDRLNGVASRTDFSAMRGAVGTVTAKFSALQVAGITALTNITNQAVNAGKRMGSALTIDPIKTGFKEYETQMNSVQTILANTSDQGTTLKDVNKALAELNTYADKTIYNFTQMTENIGKFTAAGIDLKTSTKSIQGISNLAAVSGSNAQQASTAMYQLSQALSTGALKLQDWNSVTNAGMGGKIFQNALKETAEKHGENVDKLIKKYGSFRESLRDGWISSEILTETLQKFTKTGVAEYLAKTTGLKQKDIEATQKLVAENRSGKETYDKLATSMSKTGKISKAEALRLLKMADTAEDAATKVKTFTQLWDTLQEAAQSGWTQSWQTIVGDFEEAKGLLTSINDRFSAIIGASADARNKMLSDWDKRGGRDSLIKSFNNLVFGIENVSKSFKKGFTKIIPPTTGKELAKYTKDVEKFITKFKKFTENKTNSKMFTNLGKNIAGSFKNVTTGVKNIGKYVGDALDNTFGKVTETKIKGLLSKVTGYSGKFKKVMNDFKKFTADKENANNITKTIQGVFAAFNIGKKSINAVLTPIVDFLSNGKVGTMAEKILEITGKIGETISNLDKDKTFEAKLMTISDILGNILKDIGESIEKFRTRVVDTESTLDKALSTIEKVRSFFSDVISKVLAPFKKALDFISEHISFTDIFSGVAFVGFYKFLKRFEDFMDKLSEFGEKVKKGFQNFDKAKFSEVLDSVKGTLTAFTSALNVSSLLVVSVAIALLVDSIRKFSDLEISGIVKGLAGIGGIAVILSSTLADVVKKLYSLGHNRGLLKGSVAMLIMAKSISTLADSLVALSAIRIYPMVRGLIGLAGCAVILVGVMKAMQKLDVKGIGYRQALGFVILAKALNIMADAISKVKDIKLMQMATSVGGLGASLLIMVGALKLLDMGKYEMRIKKTTVLTFLVLAESLNIVADAINKVAKLKIGEVKVALTALGGALLEMVGTIKLLDIIDRLLGKTKLGKGKSMLGSAGSIYILTKSLTDIAGFMKEMSAIKMDQVKVGLVGLGGALTEMGVVIGLLGRLGKGWSILGSFSIDIVIAGLSALGESLLIFAKLDWDEIKRALVGLGGSITEISVIPTAAAYISRGANILGAIGSAAIISQMNDLADAFAKFANLSWDEIGRGATAMGAALGELVLGSFLGIGGWNGFVENLDIVAEPLFTLAWAFGLLGGMDWSSINRASGAMASVLSQLTIAMGFNSLSSKGAEAIAKIAEPIGKLSESVIKWVDVQVPDNFANNLKAVAEAIFAFTWDSLAASNINQIGESLGFLAESVQKWANVSVPDNLKKNLKEVDKAVSKMYGTIGEKSLAEAAIPLGQMADSVKKWSDLTVPSDLGDNLAMLGSGVSSFLGSWLGAQAMKSAANAMKQLANVMAIWQQNKITLPKETTDGIANLASAIKNFNWTLLGGIVISIIAPAISQLASAMMAWKDVKVPDTLSGELEKFSAAFKQFHISIGDATTIIAVDKPLKNVADALTTFTKLKIPEGFSNTMSSASSAIHSSASTLNGVEFKAKKELTNFYNSLSMLINLVGTIKAPDSKTIDAFINECKKIAGFDLDASDLKTSSESIKAYVTNMLTTFSSILSSGKDGIDNALTTALSGMPDVITAVSTDCVTSLTSVIGALDNKLRESRSDIETASEWMCNTMSSAVKSYYDDMKEAGGYIGDGLIIGINSKTTEVYNAAYNLGRQAVLGEKKGQDSKSPSKATRKAGVWFGQGLILGINDMSKDVYNAGHGLGAGAVDSVSSAISRISDVVNGNMTLNPTITPVMDLSNVTSGTKDINNLLGKTTFDINGRATNINSAVARRRQNGTNAEVVSAINKLRGDIGNINNTSYNINGITYNQGDDVGQAIETLVRATVLNRRS